ncbi:splicing regulatory glutamine/lysine-rich protein 1 isoform X2 [Bufo gargarizans]|uniref:splicing regulatory glutamine/lysine-rich protein 1 isoform X2 n=1 Tax=Bufo gargarizans TaxID=30331 RepID=UPI001CF10CA0|nr:splicing regulatory glutamine/lysine-rich protein 1 isoform X2 [Bufo gargarizans]
MSNGQTTVIQVTNLNAAVTSEQMRTLFSFLGDVEELRLYPPDNAPLAFSSKVCYIKYRDSSSVGVAQHLTNTVFIDRALIVVPCAEGKIPEEAKALSLLAPAPTLSSLLPGAGLLPIPTPTPTPSPLASVLRREKVEVPLLSVPFTTLAATLPTPLEPVLPALGQILPALSPAITSLADLQQPPLTGNVDPTKVDEIRRTIYVGNLNSQTTTAEQLLEFFKQVGDVRFVRMAGDETQPTRFAFVEFSDQNSVIRALTFNGVMFGDRPLKINHSNNAIVKPPELTPQAAAKELEEVMKRVREAQSLISEAIEPETGKPVEKTQKLSRTRSRSESRSRWKRSRSKHSRSRNSSRSRHKEHRRSKSPLKKSSRSRDRRKSKSRSRSREKKRDKDRIKVREKERTKEKTDRRKKEKPSWSPSKSHSSARKSRSMSREGRKRRSRSLSKSPRSSKTGRKVSRSPSPRRKEKKRGKEKDYSRDRRESDRSTSKKNSNKDKEMRESSDKYKMREKDDLDTVNEINEGTVEDEVDSRHNGNCTMNEYSKSRKTEVA